MEDSLLGDEEENPPGEAAWSQSQRTVIDLHIFYNSWNHALKMGTFYLLQVQTLSAIKLI